MYLISNGFSRKIKQYSMICFHIITFKYKIDYSSSRESLNETDPVFGTQYIPEHTYHTMYITCILRDLLIHVILLILCDCVIVFMYGMTFYFKTKLLPWVCIQENIKMIYKIKITIHNTQLRYFSKPESGTWNMHTHIYIYFFFTVLIPDCQSFII